MDFSFQRLGETLLHRAVRQLVSDAIWHLLAQLQQCVRQTNPNRMFMKTSGSSPKMATQDTSQATLNSNTFYFSLALVSNKVAGHLSRHCWHSWSVPDVQSVLSCRPMQSVCRLSYHTHGRINTVAVVLNTLLASVDNSGRPPSLISLVHTP